MASYTPHTVCCCRRSSRPERWRCPACSCSDNGIEIEHACDMSCACTTCHCIVRKGFDSLNEVEECEDDLLDRAWGLEAQSRLSCQAIVANEDLTVEIPKYTINHAKENH
ncbi:ISC system 2Fe-2S type ferredoxin [Pseudomonas aeruginosa]|uniref:ISC system 2Fe-2S type ferredoxin n=1 Tax=Pseudomonas aeruginosa TaxID=287 RepID=UPI003D330CA2